MAETPQGYDRNCDQCGQPYTFDNARAVRTLNWRRFCCPGCERGETWARARRVGPSGVPGHRGETFPAPPTDAAADRT